MIGRSHDYKSKKHPMLEYIFKKYCNPHDPQQVITFFLSDISEGYKACSIAEPASISNTILDLCRQDRGISSRVPESISRLGYDLRKRTGQDASGRRYAGEFVFVGVGRALQSWLKWPENPEEIVIDSSKIPEVVLRLIRPDEGGLFSIIDYTDLLSRALYHDKIKVFRIQNPMKWQPNEIDGFYAAKIRDRIVMHPVEAKSKVTQDDTNMDQLKGGFNTVKDRLSEVGDDCDIQQLALRMIANGVDIAIFPINTEPSQAERFVRIKFNPPIHNWA